MGLNHISDALNYIADRIDSDPNPSRIATVSDLRVIISAIEADEVEGRHIVAIGLPDVKGWWKKRQEKGKSEKEMKELTKDTSDALGDSAEAYGDILKEFAPGQKERLKEIKDLKSDKQALTDIYDRVKKEDLISLIRSDEDQKIRGALIRMFNDDAFDSKDFADEYKQIFNIKPKSSGALPVESFKRAVYDAEEMIKRNYSRKAIIDIHDVFKDRLKQEIEKRRNRVNAELTGSVDTLKSKLKADKEESDKEVQKANTMADLLNGLASDPSVIEVINKHPGEGAQVTIGKDFPILGIKNGEVFHFGEEDLNKILEQFNSKNVTDAVNKLKTLYRESVETSELPGKIHQQLLALKANSEVVEKIKNGESMSIPKESPLYAMLSKIGVPKKPVVGTMVINAELFDIVKAKYPENEEIDNLVVAWQDIIDTYERNKAVAKAAEEARKAEEKRINLEEKEARDRAKAEERASKDRAKAEEKDRKKREDEEKAAEKDRKKKAEKFEELKSKVSEKLRKGKDPYVSHVVDFIKSILAPAYELPLNQAVNAIMRTPVSFATPDQENTVKAFCDYPLDGNVTVDARLFDILVSKLPESVVNKLSAEDTQHIKDIEQMLYDIEASSDDVTPDDIISQD